jgi:hypothetical protein
MVTPLKKGRYIVFDVPPDDEHEIGIYITLCREILCIRWEIMFH